MVTNPQDRLHVSGTIRVDQKIRAHDSGGLELATDDGDTRLFIKDNGYVGIGTMNPVETLDVNGNVKATGFLGDGSNLTGVVTEEVDPSFTSSAAGSIILDDINNWNEAYGWGNHATVGYLTTETDPQVGLNTENYISKWDGSALVSGTIYDNGYVGIGTTEPEEELEVNGNIALSQGADREIYVTRNSLGSGDNLSIIGGAAAWTAVNGSGGDVIINGGSPSPWGNGFDGDVLLATARGNVGIGTTSPSYILHVAGDAMADSWNTPSDKRLKKNITPIEDALTKVITLNGVMFEWKTEEYPERDFDEGKEIGIIAQEVEEVLPEVVSEDDEGYKSVDYSKLTPLLIEAIKAQQAQIEALQARIEALENN